MNKIFVLFAVLFVFSCDKSSDFASAVKPPPPAVEPPPPPAPFQKPKIDKSYTLDLLSSTINSSDVDILWVIDNSGSMGDYQRSVIANTLTFIDQFTKNSLLRWKMGLISTDKADQPYIGFLPNDVLDYKSSNAVTRFQQAVGRLGTGGDATERTYTPVLNALQKNPQFLRKNAYLALIIVTDELEQSDDGHGNAFTTAQFLDGVKALKGGSLSKFLTYGIFAYQELGCSAPDVYKGEKYEQLITQTSGKTYKLCAPDFGVVLSQLGQDLVSKIQSLSNKILLTDRPVPKTIEVYYAGKKLTPGLASDGGQWIYNPLDNVIEITDISLLNAANRQVRVVFESEYVTP